MKIVRNQTPTGENTTVTLDSTECLSVLKRTLEMPETKEKAKEIIFSYFEGPPINPSTSIDRFIVNLLWMVEELGTAAEKKIIHRLTKRLQKKYDSKSVK